MLPRPVVRLRLWVRIFYLYICWTNHFNEPDHDQSLPGPHETSDIEKVVTGSRSRSSSHGHRNKVNSEPLKGFDFLNENWHKYFSYSPSTNWSRLQGHGLKGQAHKKHFRTMHFILVTSPSCERGAPETTNGEGTCSEGWPSTFV